MLVFFSRFDDKQCNCAKHIIHSQISISLFSRQDFSSWYILSTHRVANEGKCPIHICGDAQKMHIFTPCRRRNKMCRPPLCVAFSPSRQRGIPVFSFFLRPPSNAPFRSVCTQCACAAYPHCRGLSINPTM